MYRLEAHSMVFYYCTKPLQHDIGWAINTNAFSCVVYAVDYLNNGCVRLCTRRIPKKKRVDLFFTTDRFVAAYPGGYTMKLVSSMQPWKPQTVFQHDKKLREVRVLCACVCVPGCPMRGRSRIYSFTEDLLCGMRDAKLSKI